MGSFNFFENHRKSLVMQEDLQKGVQEKIETALKTDRFFINDFEFLKKAMTVLQRVRSVLQWSYVGIYFGLPPNVNKDIFMLNQALLESAVGM